MSQQHLLSEKHVVLIPPCLIVDLFVSNLQVDVTCLDIRGTLPPCPGYFGYQYQKQEVDSHP